MTFEAISTHELQHELQRFATQFVERITQATEALERSARPELRDEVLRKHLQYTSAALEVATGPTAEGNLVDMVVFVRLCRSVLERHWIPAVYGDGGRAVGELFAEADRELRELASRALSAGQRVQLDDVIDTWLAENPRQLRVEGIRLADFAALAATESGREARGLISSLSAASRTANQALLLSERLLFLVYRLPFVWRLHVRLGARELVHDALGPLTRGERTPLFAAVRNARRLLRQSALVLVLLVGAGVVLRRKGGRSTAKRSGHDGRTIVPRDYPGGGVVKSFVRWMAAATAMALASVQPAQAAEAAPEDTYATEGSMELGGSLSGSWKPDEFALGLSPSFGLFVRDRVELSAIGGLDYDNVRSADGTRDSTLTASLVVEPSYHHPVSPTVFVFGGLGVGAAHENDRPAFEVVPRVGLNIELGRSALFDPAVRVPILIGKHADGGGTGVSAAIAFEAGFSTNF